MREIKFRAWDNVDYMSKPFGFKDLMSRTTEFTNDCVVMQYTGLKDKNGREIYEGDILRWSVIEKNGGVVKQIDTVEYKEGSFITRPTRTYTNDVDDTTSFYDEGNYEQITTESEVIGNIYENSELLEGIK